MCSLNIHNVCVLWLLRSCKIERNRVRSDYILSLTYCMLLVKLLKCSGPLFLICTHVSEHQMLFILKTFRGSDVIVMNPATAWI